MSEDYESGNTIWDKMEDHPEFPIGIVGLTSIVTYNLYKLKKKGSLKPSLFLIHMRLNAQGTLIACLGVGLLITVGKKVWHKFNKPQ